MVKFDKIKVSANLDCVKDFNADSFLVEEQNGIISALKYKSSNPRLFQLPFNLSIDLNFISDEVILNIPAKLLGINYPKLISIQTIEECINKLHEINLVEIDYHMLLTSAEILSVDVTKDIITTLTNIDYMSLSRIIRNDNKWKAEQYRNGILFQNRVSTPRHKAAFTIYNKGQEILMSKNKGFLFWCDDRGKVPDYFKDKTRVELRLRSKYLIKKYFRVEDNQLQTILMSDFHTFKYLTKQIFNWSFLKSNPIVNIEWSGIGEFKNYLVVKEADFDINKLRFLLKTIYSKKTNLRSAIRPYKSIINKKDLNHNKSKESTLGSFIEKINE